MPMHSSRGWRHRESQRKDNLPSDRLNSKSDSDPDFDSGSSEPSSENHLVRQTSSRSHPRDDRPRSSKTRCPHHGDLTIESGAYAAGTKHFSTAPNKVPLPNPPHISPAAILDAESVYSYSICLCL